MLIRPSILLHSFRIRQSVSVNRYRTIHRPVALFAKSRRVRLQRCRKTNKRYSPHYTTSCIGSVTYRYSRIESFNLSDIYFQYPHGMYTACRARDSYVRAHIIKSTMRLWLTRYRRREKETERDKQETTSSNSSHMFATRFNERRCCSYYLEGDRGFQSFAGAF